MRLHEKFFPFSKRNSFQWKSLDMQMLDFETAQCCSMFFQGSSCFFVSPMFFEQPRTKQSSNKVAWLQVALCPSWDRGMMTEWMNEWNTIHYNAMKWISKEHMQTCSLCFWRWSSCVRGWTWLGLLTHGSNGCRVTETTASIPQSWSSLAAQKHQHLVFKLVQLPATTCCVSWAVQQWMNLFTTPQVYALLLFGGKLHVDHQQVLQYTVEENVMMVCQIPFLYALVVAGLGFWSYMESVWNLDMWTCAHELATMCK